MPRFTTRAMAMGPDTTLKNGHVQSKIYTRINTFDAETAPAARRMAKQDFAKRHPALANERISVTAKLSPPP